MAASGEKERTWPSAVVPDPADQTVPATWNVRRMNGYLCFQSPVDKWIARQACYAINEAFDWGEGRPTLSTTVVEGVK